MRLRGRQRAQARRSHECVVAARSSPAEREAGTCGARGEAPMPLFRPAMAL